MRFRPLRLGILLLAASCASKQPRAPGPELVPLTEPVFETRVLVTMPLGVRCERFAVNRLGTAATWVVRRNGAYHVLREGWTSPPLRSIPPFWMTGDGGTVAYVDDDGRFMAEDKPWNTEEKVRVAWQSPDGSRFAAQGVNVLKEFMILDGRRSEDYDYVSRPIFSADGRHVAWCARRGARQWVVRDGRDLPDCGLVEAWAAQVNNPPKPIVYLPDPVFSADGTRLAYMALRNQKMCVVVDDVDGERFDSVEALTWSPRGDRLAYVATRGRQRCAVIDGVPDPSYDKVRSLAFSGDGSTLAYLASRGYTHYLVSERGGERQLPFANAENLLLSLTGEHHAFAGGGDDSRSARGGLENGSLVLDGVAGPRVRVVVYDTIRLGSDGRRTAYYLAPGTIVMDHVPGEQYPRISWPLFSPDGRHCVHYAEREGKKFVVVDGRPGPGYEDLLERSIVLSRDSRKVAFAARSGGQILWAVQDLDER